MFRKLMAATLVVAMGLSGCAFNEVTGQRTVVSGERVAFQSVEVIFADQPQLMQQGLGGFLGPTSTNVGAMYGVEMALKSAMGDMRQAAAEALVAHGIPGRARLMSERGEFGPAPIRPSHLVIVSMESAKSGTTTGTEFFWNIEIAELATREILWKGRTRLYPGGSGFTKEAQEKDKIEKRKIFGESLVRALRDAGVVKG